MKHVFEKSLSSRRTLLTLFLMSTLLTAVFALTPGVQGVTDSSATTLSMYLGVPQNLNATYTQRFTYIALAKGTLITKGGYNDSFILTPQPYSPGAFGAVFEFPFKLNIYSVQVSANYSRSLAGKNPPSKTLLFANEYIYNYSIAPYFVISPNAPSHNYTSTELKVDYYNVSVSRMASFKYSYGDISFNGPVIEQTSIYQPPPSTVGRTIIKNFYVYDAKSGLLIYWTNTTLYLLSGNSEVNITSTVYLTKTNLNSINPAGDAKPLAPPTIPPTPSSSFIGNPVFIVLIIIVIALVIVVIAAFARRR
jgi:hypothetical protein